VRRRREEFDVRVQVVAALPREPVTPARDACRGSASMHGRSACLVPRFPASVSLSRKVTLLLPHLRGHPGVQAASAS